MKHISAWFDRHPKTRIALQLVLDGLPLICLLGVIGFACVAEEYETGLLGQIAAVLMLGFAAGFAVSIPFLFVAAMLRQRAKSDFECYPICKIPSAILQLLSLIPALLSIPAVFGLISAWF